MGERGFTYADGKAALAAQKYAYGVPDWQNCPGFTQGTWDVAADHLPDFVLRLYVKVPGQRPDRPSVVLTLYEECLVRLDINGAHDGAVGTHWQGDTQRGGSQWTRWAPDVLPEYPREPPVEPHWLHQALLAHAAYAKIDVAGVAWTDPPVGGLA